MYTAEDILLERERRTKLQEKLVEEYRVPILIIRVNYPGVKKDNKFSQSIIKIMDGAVCEVFDGSIVNKIINTTAEGPIVIMSINKEARDIKSITLKIEDNHALGRCVDIDVYDENYRGISREDFGLHMRKCFICDDIAHNCVRSGKHSTEEVEGFIKNKLRSYMEKIHE
jgi:holo-ACP synthase